MSNLISNNLLQELSSKLEGEFFFDTTMRILYATDASAYREMPLAVAIPQSINDIKFVGIILKIGKSLRIKILNLKVEIL